MHDLTNRNEDKNRSEAAKYAGAQVPSRTSQLRLKLSKNLKVTLLVVLAVVATGLAVRHPHAIGQFIGSWYHDFTTGYDQGLVTPL